MTNTMSVEEIRSKSNSGIKGLLVIVWIEIRAVISNKNQIVGKLIQPFIYLLFFTVGIRSSSVSIPYNGFAVDYMAFTLPGIMALLYINMMTHAIYRSSIDRRWGILGMKFLNGVKPIYYVIGISAYPIIMFTVQFIILIVSSLVLGISFSFISMSLAFLLAIFAIVFWDTLGILITMMIHNYQQRDLIISIMILPLIYTAPTFYSLDNSPKYIKIISQFNPVTYQVTAIRDALLGIDNMYTIIISITFTFLSIVMFSLCSKYSKLLTSEH